MMTNASEVALAEYDTPDGSASAEISTPDGETSVIKTVLPRQWLSTIANSLPLDMFSVLESVNCGET